VDADFAQVAEVAEVFHVAAHRLGQRLPLAEAKLDRVVAVALLRLDLHNHAGPGLDHGDAARLARGREHLRHPQLLAVNRFCHLSCRFSVFSCQLSQSVFPAPSAASLLPTTLSLLPVTCYLLLVKA